MRTLLFLPLLVACDGEVSTAPIRDGDWSTAAYLDDLRQQFDADQVQDSIDALGPYADATLTLDGTEGRFTAGDIDLDGFVERVEERRWNRMCRGTVYALRMEDSNRAEWMTLELEEPVDLPEVDLPATSLRLTGYTSCADEGSVREIDIVAVTDSGLEWSLTNVGRTE